MTALARVTPNTIQQHHISLSKPKSGQSSLPATQLGQPRSCKANTSTEQPQMCVLAITRALHMHVIQTTPGWEKEKPSTHVSGLKPSQLWLQKAFQESFSQIR